MARRLRLWCGATQAVLRRDAIVYFTYRAQFATQMLSLVFQLATFYFVSMLLHAKSFANPGAYFAYVVVGLAITASLSTTVGLMPNRVRQELVAGTLERFLVSPFGATNGIVAMMVFPVLSSIVTGTILLGLAAGIFGLSLAGTAPLAIPVAVLGSFAFLPFTLTFVAAVIAFKQSSAGTQFFIGGVAIVGGLYFPPSLLPGWLRWLSDIQPFTPAADLMRHLLLGTPSQSAVAVDLAKIVGFAVVLTPVSLWIVSRAIDFGRRRGTIIEY